MKKNLLRLFSALFTFTFLISSCKQTTTTSQTTTGNIGSCIIGKWSSGSLPLNLKMSSEFSGDYTNSDLVGGLNPLEQVAQAWNNATLPSTTLITTPFPIASTTGYSSTSSFRDGEIGIYKSHSWFSGVSSGALAITQFYGVVTASPALGGQYINLTHADIIVNYRDYGSRITMSYNPFVEFDLPTIVLHEMGHLVGLCHESSRPSVMAPYYLTTQRSLQNYDIDLIKDIYVDGVITPFSAQAKNTNALSSSPGTEVKGVIELHADGKCIHYINGKKIYEHTADLKRL
ncbi:MAG: matrixin family metalloprotease [Bdellovibrionales bacterium]|nr:matrixin family metalloprotease [Bdellovibrionales bacterium]